MSLDQCSSACAASKYHLRKSHPDSRLRGACVAFSYHYHQQTCRLLGAPLTLVDATDHALWSFGPLAHDDNASTRQERSTASPRARDAAAPAAAATVTAATRSADADLDSFTQLFVDATADDAFNALNPSTLGCYLYSGSGSRCMSWSPMLAFTTEDCASYCLAQSSCVAFVFDSMSCYLSDGIAMIQRDSTIESYVLKSLSGESTSYALGSGSVVEGQCVDAADVSALGKDVSRYTACRDYCDADAGDVETSVDRQS